MLNFVINWRYLLTLVIKAFIIAVLLQIIEVIKDEENIIDTSNAPAVFFFSYYCYYLPLPFPSSYFPYVFSSLFYLYSLLLD